MAHRGPVEWGQSLIDKLDAALNEASVRGFAFDGDEARLLLEVLALTEDGRVDPDVRRVIVMSGVGRIDIRLRLDEPEPGPGPLIPVPSLDALQRFFDSLTFAHSMYGWAFVDVQDPNQWWSGETSLSVPGSSAATDSHTLLWFTECGDGTKVYALGGIVAFTTMSVERANGSPIALQEFADDGARWWKAFSAGDPQVSGQAQQATSQAAQVWWPARRARSAVVPAGEWNPSE